MNEIRTIKKVREFMFADVQRGIDGKANFMVALALSVYTEVWGKFLEGIPRGNSPQCYKSFFRRLGKCYKKLLDDGIDVYHDVRCGLVHSYMIERTSTVNMGTGTCGITYSNGKYEFNILTYFDDFKRAVDQYVSDVQADKKLQSKLKDALRGKPILI